MEKINALSSANIVADNIEILKQLFPTIVKEGNIDLNELKALLGENVEDKDEYYRFTWAGKSEARLEANKPTTATLRPNKKDSKDWDTTGNIFIEGDNLEVLKLMQKSYANKIKMIYIDPPYNTGKDFVYKDNYTDNLGNYLEITGQVDESGKKLNTNTESDGRYHSNWLNMMYPRLRLARNLMTDDGVIFISIDDNEVHNLKKVCDEIFGEENFVANLIWEQGKKSAGKLITINHEYCLVYLKNKIINENTEEQNLFKEKKEGLELIYKKEEELRSKYNLDFTKIGTELKKFYKSFPENSPILRNKHYCYVDKKGIYFPDNVSAPDKPETRSKRALIHPITKKPCLVPSMGWRYSDITIDKLIEEDKIHFGEDENKVPCYKRYLKDTEFESMSSVFYKDGRGASKRLSFLLDNKVFDFPKDETVLKKFINSVTLNNDIILDFFSGSGTTAHAVMQLNAEDGGTRKCISVQLPEPTDEKSEAFKAGYSTIAEITKERIRRAGEKIKKDFKDKDGIDKLDVGFKAFKLDSSNITAWDGNPDNLEQQLDVFANNIKTNRTEEDILFEILLKYGLDLTVPIEEKNIAGKTVYSIGLGTLFICLADGITPQISEGIGAWKQELNPSICRAIFKDSGFASDKDKVNAMQILKRFGIEEVNSI